MNFSILDFLLLYGALVFIGIWRVVLMSKGKYNKINTLGGIAIMATILTLLGYLLLVGPSESMTEGTGIPISEEESGTILDPIGITLTRDGYILMVNDDDGKVYTLKTNMLKGITLDVMFWPPHTNASYRISEDDNGNSILKMEHLDRSIK